MFDIIYNNFDMKAFQINRHISPSTPSTLSTNILSICKTML